MSKIVGFLVFAIMLIFVAIGIHGARTQANKVENAQRTPAVILKKHLHSHESRDEDGGTTTSYLPEITYRCDFDGGTVVSTDVFPLTVSQGGTSGRRWAKSILKQYQVGQAVQAWYNPKDPNQTFLIREISFIPYVFILVAGLVSALFVTFSWRGTDDSRNRKLAMFGTMLMGVCGAAVWKHYFGLAGTDTDGIVKPVMAGYFVAAAIPFATSLPSSGFADRLKSGLILGAVMGFVGIWLGLLGGGLIGFATETFKSMDWIEQSFGGPHWVAYTIPALAVPGFLFGLIANKQDPAATQDDPLEVENDDGFADHHPDEYERQQ